MKTLPKLIATILFLGLILNTVYAQKEKVAVFSLQFNGIQNESEIYADVVRMELQRLGRHHVMDANEIDYVLANSNEEVNQCFASFCLKEMGDLVGATKVVTGSIKKIGERIYINLKEMDVKTAQFVNSEVIDFLDVEERLDQMVRLTIRRMYDAEIEENLLNRLTSEEAFETRDNIPTRDYLHLQGPRTGFTMLTGDNAKIFRMNEAQGGYEGYPLLFQFGYQFEKKYLNSGGMQALVEFIPMIAGMDQGKFIPSFTLLNGFRNNNNGWEFAVGPTFTIGQRSRGFERDGEWIRESDFIPSDGEGMPQTEWRNDSNGDSFLSTGVVIAAGKSFRSGDLNFPVNVYAVPNKNGVRFGLSFGFNSSKWGAQE